MRIWYRRQVLLFVVLCGFLCWKVVSTTAEEKMRHLRNAISDIETIQKHTSDQLDLISHGLSQLSQKRISPDESAQIINIKQSLDNISSPGPKDFLEHLPLNFNFSPGFESGDTPLYVDYILGIPTVNREVHSYILDTLDSLISGADGSGVKFAIVIYIGETEVEVAEDLASVVSSKYTTVPIKIIAPPKGYYPRWDHIDETNINNFGDNPERLKWRRKQNLDYLFLWTWCIGKSNFYLQLEDDIIAKPKYLEFVDKAVQKETSSWFILEFSNLGFIGKLFRNSQLRVLVNFVMLFYKEKPVDWLLDNLLYTKVCSPEKSDKSCASSKKKIKRTMRPSQFQHVGTHSSLAGKVQKLQDGSFDPKKKTGKNSNPVILSIISDIPIFKHFSLARVWAGTSIFWGTAVVKDSYIIYNFREKVMINEITILSGGDDHPTDKMPEGSTVRLFSEALLSAEDLTPSGGQVMGNFDAEGRFIVNLSPSISSQSIVIQISAESNYWLAIYDITIRTQN